MINKIKNLPAGLIKGTRTQAEKKKERKLLILGMKQALSVVSLQIPQKSNKEILQIIFSQ